MRVRLGPVDEIPRDRCLTVADGRVIVLRVDDEVVAFENRCLHQNSPLEGARVFDGTLQCPLHFWRYRLPEGVHVGGEGVLGSYPVLIENGEAVVEVPDPPPVLSVREMMLQHAREWERDQ